jgi:hypothetical protein
MSKPESSFPRRLDAWAFHKLDKRFPRIARLQGRTLYRYAALATTVAWLILRVPRWGARELRLLLGAMSLWLLAVLVVDQVATQVRRRRKQQ